VCICALLERQYDVRLAGVATEDRPAGRVPLSELNTDLETLAEFGGGVAGITRVAWSDALDSANRWLMHRGRGVGLDVSTDPAGNVFVGRPGSGTQGVLLGSHVDTVPNGGRYDGALGVLGALHAMRALGDDVAKRAGRIAVAAFMDEEGTRFGTDLFGSRAFVGDDLTELAGRVDREGVTLTEAMAERGYAFAELGGAAAVTEYGCYLELHIEQGPVLEEAGADVGIVTAIVGLLGLQVEMTGEANHAGTTPMHLRRDALAGGARAIGELRDLALAEAGITANVGTILVEPGGKNVVPGVCRFTVDVRAANPEAFAQLDHRVRTILLRIAGEEGLTVNVEELYRLEPLTFDAGLVDVVEASAMDETTACMRLPSGAGHDAMVVGRHIPTAMVFVPSRGGISHSPFEYTEPAHCDLGARVLARTIGRVLA
jgi:hydantoinase/carbamoylase family amidase